MAEVASAYVTLVPRFKDLSGYIDGALGGSKVSASAASAGKKAASAFSASFVGGAAMGAVSTAVSSAMGAISSSLGSAIARVDTMNNFPRVMESLGYGAESAQWSIDRMAASIDGLPTSLNALTSMTQRLTSTTGDLDYATGLSIALNHALLAGGASTVDVERALVQYTQALAKGKPELEDWRTLQEVMPGQLDQIAKSMLGAEANSNSLYEAMKSGELSMWDFNEALMRLDTEGGEGIASFEAQARNATQGIGTALTNVGNRVSKAVGTVIEAIGADAIAGAINKFSSQFAGWGNAVADQVTKVKSGLSTLSSAVDPSAFKALSTAFGDLKSAISGALPDLGAWFSAWAQGEGAQGLANAAVRSLADVMGDAARQVKSATGAVKKFVSRVKASGSVERFADAVGGVWSSLKVLSGVLSNVVKTVSRWVLGSDAAGDAASAFSLGLDALSTAAGAAANVLEAVAGNVGRFFSTLSGNAGMQRFVQSVRDLAGALVGVGSPLGGVVSAMANLSGGTSGAALAAERAGVKLDALASAVEWVTSHLDRVVPAVAGAAAAFMAMRNLGAVASVVSSVSRAFSGVASAVGLFMSPAGLVLGAVSALVGAFSYFWSTSDEFRANVTAAWDGISGKAQEVWPQVQGAVGSAMDSVGGVVQAVLPVVQGLFETAWPAVCGAVSAAMGGVQSAVELGMPLVQGIFETATPVIQGLFETAWPLVQQAAESALGAVRSVAETAIPAVQSLVETGLPAVQGIFEAVFPAALAAVQAAIPVVQGVFEAAMPLVQSLVETALPAIQGVFEAVMPVVQSAVETAMPLVQGFFEGAMSAVQLAVETAMPVVQSVVEGVMPVVQGVIETALPLIQGLFESTWPLVRSAVETAMAAIQLVVDTVMPVIQAVFDTVWPAVQATVVTVFGIIQSVVSTAMDFINTVISVITSIIKGDWEGAWDAIKTFLSDTWEKIKTAVSDAVAAVKQAISDKVGEIKRFWSDAWEGVKKTLSDAWENIKQAVSDGVTNVVSFFTDLPGNIISALGDVGSMLWQAGSDIIGGFFDGLKSMWSDVTGWFEGIGEWIVQHKGPPAYDAVMLTKNGELIMRGLNRGLANGWGETMALLEGYTEEMARAGDAMSMEATVEARGPVARSARAEATRGPASAGVVIENMNINARDLADVRTVEQFSARVLGRELAVL